MKKILLLGIAVIILGAGMLWLTTSSKETTVNDFPYVIRDGQVYCSDGGLYTDGDLVEQADASTFRQPTQEERDAALSRGRLFLIDAVDNDTSFFQCSRVNFSGTI